MKALSIKQPWAWLIVNGYKCVENRTWDTKFRGEFAVHAGKRFDQDGYDWVRETFPEIEMPEPKDFERGGIVGVASIYGTVHDTTKLSLSQAIVLNKWFVGPWGFVMFDQETVPFVPWRGQLGFFNVPDDVIQKGGE